MILLSSYSMHLRKLQIQKKRRKILQLIKTANKAVSLQAGQPELKSAGRKRKR
jgi:hypothetical protein